MTQMRVQDVNERRRKSEEGLDQEATPPTVAKEDIGTSARNAVTIIRNQITTGDLLYCKMQRGNKRRRIVRSAQVAN